MHPPLQDGAGIGRHLYRRCDLLQCSATPPLPSSHHSLLHIRPQVPALTIPREKSLWPTPSTKEIRTSPCGRRAMTTAKYGHVLPPPALLLAESRIRFPETSDDSQVSENSTSFSPTAIWCPVTRRHRAVSQIQSTYNVRITCLKVLRIKRHPRTIPQSEYYPIPRKQVVSHTQLHNVRNHARI